MAGTRRMLPPAVGHVSGCTCSPLPVCWCFPLTSVLMLRLLSAPTGGASTQCSASPPIRGASRAWRAGRRAGRRPLRQNSFVDSACTALALCRGVRPPGGVEGFSGPPLPPFPAPTRPYMGEGLAVVFRREVSSLPRSRCLARPASGHCDPHRHSLPAGFFTLTLFAPWWSLPARSCIRTNPLLYASAGSGPISSLSFVSPSLPLRLLSCLLCSAGRVGSWGSWGWVGLVPLFLPSLSWPRPLLPSPSPRRPSLLFAVPPFSFASPSSLLRLSFLLCLLLFCVLFVALWGLLRACPSSFLCCCCSAAANRSSRCWMAPGVACRITTSIHWSDVSSAVISTAVDA